MACPDLLKVERAAPFGAALFSLVRAVPAARALLRCGQRRLLGRRSRSLGGSFLLALLEDERVAFASNLAQAVHHRAGAGRDETTDDDVLLEAFERIDLAIDGGLSEDTRRLLEGRRGDERARLQRG